MSTKRIRWLITLLVLAAIPTFWAFVIEPRLLFVREYTVDVPRLPQSLNGLRVALVSDIHAGSLHINDDKIREIVQKTNQAKPDLILLLGDFVNGHGKDVWLIDQNKFVENIAQLKARYGTYAVLGNHDWWYNGDQVRKTLKRATIPVLENSVVSVDCNGTTVYLAGLADKWTRRADLSGTLSKVPPGAPVILMMHNPDSFSEGTTQINLTVAGHTHGGQVSLPFLGRLVVPAKHSYSRGLIIEDGRRMFVTSGIGTSLLPMRFCVPPEISVLTLHGLANEN